MKIRKLTAKDAKIYRKLRMEALKQFPNAFLMTLEEEEKRIRPIKYVSEQLKDPNCYTIGAFLNEQLIGVVTLQKEKTLKIKHKGNVLSMIVAPKCQGMGIGKMLLQSIIKIAKENKLEQLYLSVVSDNFIAKKLYASVGFHPYGLERNALKWNNKYWDEEHMVLFLSSKQVTHT
ncbi:GNAT family N-acetyltransferase [Bacillus sp. 03113]|uniref:GNAT family N-acetyltransferase n=1 Tax=Bacillus sp. 03113 TaxID=2578211 RepID=UPI001144D635|nr:GNAT family N-acetyltransferase [Bacillus sp. 03113]